MVGDEGEPIHGEGGGSEVPADVRGTLVHEVLARSISVSPPSKARTRARLEQLLLPDSASPEALVQVTRWAHDLASSFLRSPLGIDAGSRPGTRTEHPFLVSFDSFLLRGTVDLLVPSEAGWILADYKSSDITALEVPARVAEQELQVQLYALALRSMGLQIDQAHVVYLVPEVVSPVDLSEEALGQAAETLQTFVNARAALDLPATPSHRCRWCPWSSASGSTPESWWWATSDRIGAWTSPPSGMP